MNESRVTSGRMEESDIPDISKFASGISYANDELIENESLWLSKLKF